MPLKESFKFSNKQQADVQRQLILRYGRLCALQLLEPEDGIVIRKRKRDSLLNSITPKVDILVSFVITRISDGHRVLNLLHHSFHAPARLCIAACSPWRS